MQLWEHALVKDSHHQDIAVAFTPEKHHVLAHLDPRVLRPCAMNAPEGGVVGESRAARFKRVQVTDQLVRAPVFEGVGADLVQVEFGSAGVLNAGHRLGLARHAETGANPIEHAVVGQTAAFAFGKRRM